MTKQCAGIGMKKSFDPDVARERFEAVIKAVSDFVLAHPEMLAGDGEFTVVFGPRERINVTEPKVQGDPGRPVPSHGSGPGGPLWQPPNDEPLVGRR